MPDHKEIYGQHAEQYERLVSQLDYQNNIPRALVEIHPLEEYNVVELGAGTGRLTRILTPLVNTIWSFDVSHHMLRIAARVLEASEERNWRLTVSDHRNLPLNDGIADVAISGWSVCYLAVWSGEKWKQEVSKALREMERVLGHNGVIILVEGLGTGNKQPKIPETLREYYEYLEEEGFNKKWIRTDYEFESSEEAKKLLNFFFGEKPRAETIAILSKKDKWVKLPVCTAIWWKST